MLFSIFTVTLLAIATTISFLFNSAPDSHQIIAIFYGTIIVGIVGSIFFVFYVVNYLRFQETPPFSTIMLGLRYGLLVAIYTAFLMLLGSQHLLNYPVAITILVIVVIADLLWRRRRTIKTPR